MCIKFLSLDRAGEHQNEGAHGFNPNTIINGSDSEDDETSASKLLKQVSYNQFQLRLT